jgi:hypothetical protein
MDAQLFSLAKTYFILSNILTAGILFFLICYCINLLVAFLRRPNRRRRAAGIKLYTARIRNVSTALRTMQPYELQATENEIFTLLDEIDELI